MRRALGRTTLNDLHELKRVCWDRDLHCFADSSSSLSRQIAAAFFGIRHGYLPLKDLLLWTSCINEFSYCCGTSLVWVWAFRKNNFYGTHILGACTVCIFTNIYKYLHIQSAWLSGAKLSFGKKSLHIKTSDLVWSQKSGEKKFFKKRTAFSKKRSSTSNFKLSAVFRFRIPMASMELSEPWS